VRMVTFARGYQATSGIETIDVSIGGLSFVPTVTGLTEQVKSTNNFSVYPNPNTGVFTVDFTSNQTEKVTLNAVDILGKLIYSKEINAVKGNNQIPLDIRDKVSKNSMLFISVQGESSKYTNVKVLIH